MSWKFHSDFMSYKIEREFDDIENHPKMHYRATGYGQELFSKNLSGIKEAVREAKR